MASGFHKHKTNRSVSEALGSFRIRRGSVSENAQELAEALKAPVSYKLIVIISILDHLAVSDTTVGSLHCLVYDFGVDEHLLEIDIERVSQARHSDHRSIR